MLRDLKTLNSLSYTHSDIKDHRVTQDMGSGEECTHVSFYTSLPCPAPLFPAQPALHRILDTSPLQILYEAGRPVTTHLLS